MDKFAYIAATAAKNTLLAQAVTSHNMANANTAGFKADLDQFTSNPVYGPGSATRVYAQDENGGFDQSAGTLVNTGNPLDLGITGKGWFTVQNLQGEVGFSRRGDFRTDANGTLRNGDGFALLGQGASPITLPPYESISVADDGTISVRPPGAAANELAVIDRVGLVQQGQSKLIKGKDGLFRTENGEELAADAAVKLRAGNIESSNVNSVDSMVEMIEHSRAFQFQVRLLEQAETLDNAASGLLSIN